MNSNETNLFKEKNKVLPAEMVKNFSLRGETKPWAVYKIPLDMVYYNHKNGRIATLISKWEAENGYEILKIKENNCDNYNETIENYIEKSNPKALERTKNNIQKLGQREAGVVLSNGCIIDGNRRYTCLRKLNEEEPSGKYGYFYAVILPEEMTADDKEIKRLELELQHGQDEKVSYNPIETLIDVYKTIVEEKLLSVSEYATNCDKKISEIEKSLKQAEIIVDFLDYINASGKYYIAVDLQLDASVSEIYTAKQKLSEEAWEKAKIILYDNMLVKTKGDIKFIMRDIKKIALSEKLDQFFEEHCEIAKELHDKIAEKDECDSDFIKDEIRSDDKLKTKLLESCEKYLHKVNIDTAQKLPVEQISDASKIIEKVDLDALKYLKTEDMEDFINIYKYIKEKIEEIGNIVNEIK